jgi:hypothetical protein
MTNSLAESRRRYTRTRGEHTSIPKHDGGGRIGGPEHCAKLRRRVSGGALVAQLRSVGVQLTMITLVEFW